MNIKLIGQAKYVFQMVEILATFEPIETDLEWWELRLWIRRN